MCYATWSGLGIFTIAILGYIFFKQTLAWQAIWIIFNCCWSNSGKQFYSKA